MFNSTIVRKNQNNVIITPMKRLLNDKRIHIITLVFVIALILEIFYLGFQNTQFKKEFKEIKTNLASTTSSLISLRQDLDQTKENQITLNDNISEEVKKVSSSIDSKIDDISGTIGTLDKLLKTDPELLQKYSKVFFLNEHYAPAQLSIIPEKYISELRDSLLIQIDILPFLENLLKNAEANNIDIKVLSAFRSFNEQTKLKYNYVVTYGSGTANTFSADQGYSEHQLGTTVDFTNSIIKSDLNSFTQTKAYGWLLKNAYRYGFTLSYPEDNTYYQSEPWHWRFVGKKLAYQLHIKNISFYDMSQREIDEYIVSFFDLN